MNILEFAQQYIKWAWNDSFTKGCDIISVADKTALIVYRDFNVKFYLLRESDDSTVTIDYFCMDFGCTLSDKSQLYCKNYQITQTEYRSDSMPTSTPAERSKVLDNYRRILRPAASELLFHASPEVRNLAKMVMEE